MTNIIIKKSILVQMNHLLKKDAILPNPLEIYEIGRLV